jgi:hypothetical protein
MNKRDLIFTAFTVLFFGGLLLLVMAYSQWFEEFSQDAAVGLSAASYATYIDDDITQALIDINHLNNVTIRRDNIGNVSVSFDGLFNSSRDYYTRLQDFERFIEGNYSKALNVNVTLEGLKPQPTISVYNVTTEDTVNQTGGTEFYVYTEDYGKLREINITLIVRNETKLTQTFTPSNEPNPDTMVRVRMVSYAGVEYYNEAMPLAAEGSNQPFRARFAKGEIADVEFGHKHQSTLDGVLFIKYDFNLTIAHFEMIFEDQNETIRVDLNGTLTIDPKVGGINLSRMTIVEG